MAVHKEVSFLAYLLVLVEYFSYMLMPNLVPRIVVILRMGYVHVQKKVQKNPYAPIVVQVIRVVTTTVLTGLLFVKESLTPRKAQKLAL
ncbi:hypothetical protein P3L10_009052 [Capsicum annuum]